VSPLQAAAGFLAVPYRELGRSPETGWDCVGCLAFLRRELFDKDTPGLSETHYTRREALEPEAVANMIKAKLDRWHTVEPAPGAVALLDTFGRPAHVGLFLDRLNVIHCDRGHGTVIQRLDPLLRPRLRGVYDCST
jgi:cell wall-associated NlpC family hydrolase